VLWNQPWFSNATYRVRRAVAGSGSFADLTPTPITKNFFDDILPDPHATYTYEVTALYPDGTSGTATADFTPPAATDPTGFIATVKDIDEVELSWDAGTPGRVEYFISGPGTGTGVTVPGTPVIPVHPHRFSYTVKGLPAGTHTWRIASSFQPGGVLTTAAQWPSATATLAVAGRYEISIESVKVTSEAIDDIFDGDGKRNEVYVTAFARTKDQSGAVLKEASYRSPTYGDITNWSGRVQAGSAGPNGGVWHGDLIDPIWQQPSSGATGWTRMVVWLGALTAGKETVDIDPAVWEADPAGFRNGRFTYENLLRQMGYTILDLNTRTAYGDISNVMLAAEHSTQTAGTRALGFHIMTEEDRPIGISKRQDPLDDGAYWFPFAIQVNQSVAEAALSGTYGAPGIIPVLVVDHKEMSRDTFTHPDLGMVIYTINIRIKRLP
jgi:hypothetical protein